MFTSVHNHSEYSNLKFRDCTIKTPLLIDKAIELGYNGICLTDHEALSGHMIFLEYYQSLREQGKLPEDFRIGLGNEIYLVDFNGLYDDQGNPKKSTIYYHFILVAKDKAGHNQLRAISTDSWSHWIRHNGAERIATYKQTLEEIIGRNPGHVIASTACLGGELAKKIVAKENPLPFLKWLSQVFGPENVFMEMQARLRRDHDEIHEQFIVNQAIAELTEQTKLNAIVTTDTHYLTRDDRYVHEAFLNSDPKNRGSRELADFYESTYMMSEDEIRMMLNSHLDKDQTEVAIANTQKIHDMLEDYDLKRSIIVPIDKHIPEFAVRHLFSEWYEKFPVIKEFAYSEEEQNRYLLYLIENGFEKWNQEYNETNIGRISEELTTLSLVSERLGQPISSYYVLVAEMLKNILWKKSFVGVARGSVTGFYIAYLMDIIQINPIEYNLPAYRHLHFSRPELPDCVCK